MNNITKNALEESLKKFLLQKPLDKITINDLAEDCGIIICLYPGSIIRRW